jgi:hypothetical protein
MCCLANHPLKRFQSARELRLALQSYIDRDRIEVLRRQILLLESNVADLATAKGADEQTCVELEERLRQVGDAYEQAKRRFVRAELDRRASEQKISALNERVNQLDQRLQREKEEATATARMAREAQAALTDELTKAKQAEAVETTSRELQSIFEVKLARAKEEAGAAEATSRAVQEQLERELDRARQRVAEVSERSRESHESLERELVRATREAEAAEAALGEVKARFEQELDQATKAREAEKQKILAEREAREKAERHVAELNERLWNLTGELVQQQQAAKSDIDKLESHRKRLQLGAERYTKKIEREKSRVETEISERKKAESRALELETKLRAVEGELAWIRGLASQEETARKRVEKELQKLSTIVELSEPVEEQDLSEGAGRGYLARSLSRTKRILQMKSRELDESQVRLKEEKSRRIVLELKLRELEHQLSKGDQPQRRSDLLDDHVQRLDTGDFEVVDNEVREAITSFQSEEAPTPRRPPPIPKK